MIANTLPSQTYLEECFEYKAETGELTWRDRPVVHFENGSHRPAEWLRNNWVSHNAGKPALNHPHSTGYMTGKLNATSVKAHRVIWKLVYGSDPDQIDHINGDKRDNRITNLRSASASENCRNTPLRRVSSSGHLGVNRNGLRWVAKIWSGGRDHYLGIFKEKNDAIAARKAAEKQHGFHPNHGRAKA